MKPTTRHLFKMIFTGLAVICLGALGGCAGGPSTTVALLSASEAGPAPASSDGMQGYLKVYTATEQYCNSDGGFMYYPHTGYSVLNKDGARFKSVDNRMSGTDETPEKVALPVGAYFVQAQSELAGGVKFPVVIRGGRTTVVLLEQGKTSDPDAQKAGASHPIQDPQGKVIGWSRTY
jgi:hypothetical protein